MCKTLNLKSQCEINIHHHSDAVVTLNFLLEAAFKAKDLNLEITVYEKLAICHFYLSNLEKSNYYLTRMMRGLVDPPNSEL